MFALMYFCPECGDELVDEGSRFESRGEADEVVRDMSALFHGDCAEVLRVEVVRVD